MSIKIRIQVGAVEIEYEGSEDFFKAELSNIMNQVSKVQGTFAVNDGSSVVIDSNQSSPSIPSAPTPLFEMTTNTIAAQLGISAGADLVMAACAHLAFVRNKDTFTRAEILQEMKAATSYYQNNYSSNLSKMLKSLVKGNKLIERSKDVYALQANQRRELERQLVDPTVS